MRTEWGEYAEGGWIWKGRLDREICKQENSLFLGTLLSIEMQNAFKIDARDRFWFFRKRIHVERLWSEVLDLAFCPSFCNLTCSFCILEGINFLFPRRD